MTEPCRKQDKLMRLLLGMLWESYYTIDSDFKKWEMARIEFNAAAEDYKKCLKENGYDTEIGLGHKVMLTPEESDNFLVDDNKVKNPGGKSFTKPLLTAEERDRLLGDEGAAKREKIKDIKEKLESTIQDFNDLMLSAEEADLLFKKEKAEMAPENIKGIKALLMKIATDFDDLMLTAEEGDQLLSDE